MRPFNLEEALAGKPVVTRDGRKVTEIYHFKTANKTAYPITAVADGDKLIFSKDGGFWQDERESINDLFMAPESIEVWVNVWRSSRSGGYFTYLFLSEADAAFDNDRNTDLSFIKTQKITIEL